MSCTRPDFRRLILDKLTDPTPFDALRLEGSLFVPELLEHVVIVLRLLMISP